MTILKYRTGCNLQREVFPLSVSPAYGQDRDIFSAPFKARYMPHRPNATDRRPACLFEIALPRQLGLAYRLLRLVMLRRDLTMNAMTSRSADTLRNRLASDLGLIPRLDLPLPKFIGREEASFLAAINEDPGDLLNWSAYADWLEERGDPRGATIRRNLSGRAVTA